jgi:hypothetical protein
MKRGINFLGHVGYALWHVVIALAAVAGFSAIVMLLWNWLMPAIFGLASISIWQSLGLLALARILFSGLGAGRFGGMGHHRNPIHEKWKRMTAEERMEFMKKRPFHRCFGRDFLQGDESGKQMTAEERMEFMKRHPFHHGFGRDFMQEDEPGKQE